MSALPAPPRTPDTATVDVLVGNHRRFLGFLERRVGSREAAEDILQDVFVRGMSRADSLRDQESAVNNASVRVHRARLALRRQLEKSCGTCAAHGCFQCECDERHPPPPSGPA